jgi:hypothetical protein
LNAAQRFTGRMDVDLSDVGVDQAHAAAALMRDCDVVPDVLISIADAPRATDRRGDPHRPRTHGRPVGAVLDFNLPPGHPVVYDIASDGRASPRGGRYLDPTSASRAAEQIAGERRNLTGPSVE